MHQLFAKIDTMHVLAATLSATLKGFIKYKPEKEKSKSSHHDTAIKVREKFINEHT
jgi:hypothetical protein